MVRCLAGKPQIVSRVWAWRDQGPMAPALPYARALRRCSEVSARAMGCVFLFIYNADGGFSQNRSCKRLVYAMTTCNGCYKRSVKREETLCMHHPEPPAFTSTSSIATTSDIVLRLAGSPFQHPSIISHTQLESSEWSGRAGRRPFNIE